MRWSRCWRRESRCSSTDGRSRSPGAGSTWCPSGKACDWRSPSADPPPAHVAIRAYVFPYDPIHQTFINLYEEDAIRLQAILDAARQTVEYYAGTTQGRLAVIRTFVLSGIEHILIGPDHILFLIGLLLLGGTLARLALIVTAFTIGHSITLSLAALDILSPPAYFIEPLIALTIVVVGADNLLVLRAGAGHRTAADIRAWLAAGFGLIHGFGFAYVLKEFGLPQAALGVVAVRVQCGRRNRAAADRRGGGRQLDVHQEAQSRRRPRPGDRRIGRGDRRGRVLVYRKGFPNLIASHQPDTAATATPPRCADNTCAGSLKWQNIRQPASAITPAPRPSSNPAIPGRVG